MLPIALVADSRALRRPGLAFLLVATLALAGLTAAGPAAAAPSTGWIRLAHLSPDTPKVDVYLSSFADPEDSQTLRGVGYGAVSPYQRIAPGTYTVAMRGAGAAADSPPLLTTNVFVEAGKAYTVAGVGPNAEVALRVINDDLTPPPAGRARVRVVHAAAAVPVADITVGDTPLAGGTRFASTTDYATLPAGPTPLQLRPTEGTVQPVTQTLDLRAGGVYSVLVLDGKDGGVQVLLRTDAASVGDLPSGAVATGAGGTASGPVVGADRQVLPVPVAVGLLTALLSLLVLGRRQRAAAR